MGDKSQFRSVHSSPWPWLELCSGRHKLSLNRVTHARRSAWASSTPVSQSMISWVLCEGGGLAAWALGSSMGATIVV